MYFPEDHLYAVYLPLLAPLVFPLVFGLIRELKRFFRLKRLSKKNIGHSWFNEIYIPCSSLSSLDSYWLLTHSTSIYLQTYTTLAPSEWSDVSVLTPDGADRIQWNTFPDNRHSELGFISIGIITLILLWWEPWYTTRRNGAVPKVYPRNDENSSPKLWKNSRMIGLNSFKCRYRIVHLWFLIHAYERWLEFRY